MPHWQPGWNTRDQDRLKAEVAAAIAKGCSVRLISSATVSLSSVLIVCLSEARLAGKVF